MDDSVTIINLGRPFAIAFYSPSYDKKDKTATYAFGELRWSYITGAHLAFSRTANILHRFMEILEPSREDRKWEVKNKPARLSGPEISEEFTEAEVIFERGASFRDNNFVVIEEDQKSEEAEAPPQQFPWYESEVERIKAELKDEFPDAEPRGIFMSENYLLVIKDGNISDCFRVIGQPVSLENFEDGPIWRTGTSRDKSALRNAKILTLGSRLLGSPSPTDIPATRDAEQASDQATATIQSLSLARRFRRDEPQY